MEATLVDTTTRNAPCNMLFLVTPMLHGPSATILIVQGSIALLVRNFSTKPVRRILDVKYRPLLFSFHPFIFDHSVYTSVVITQPNHRLTANLASILASSPSTLRASCGVLASKTKWLSQ